VSEWSRPGSEGLRRRRGERPASVGPSEEKVAAAYSTGSDRIGGATTAPIPPVSRPTDGRPTTEHPAARRGPRRARLAVKRIDPWSVLKFTFLFSLAMLVAFVVAVAVLYGVLDAMGVFASIKTTIKDLSVTSDTTVDSWFSLRRILGWTAIIGVVNVILLTALATLGAFLYNVCSDLVGGIEVTLSERE
jgi:hypothetical protein